MEPNQENTQPQPPAKRSLLVETLTGTALGSAIGLITSTFNKTTPRSKQTAIGAIIGAGVGVGLNLLTAKDPVSPASAVPPAPPATPVPPISPTHAPDLQLAQVPQILDLLATQGKITAAQQQSVLASIKSGREGFAGELAVADGFITAQQLQDTLAEQANRKAEASLVDIQSISTMVDTQHGAIAAPAWLRANWGNNGVNPAPAAPTRTDGAAAAANAAQNLVMLAFSSSSKDPALMPVIREGVLAAANLTRGITQGDSAQVPFAKMADTWRTSMNTALQVATQANPQLLTDAKGQSIDINNYLAARDTEITAAIKQTIATGTDRSQNQGRA